MLTASLPWQAAAAVVLGTSALAVGLGLALTFRAPPGKVLTGAAAVFAALYLVAFFGLVADTSMLAFLGYVPVILVKLVIDPGWVTGREVPWLAIMNQFILLAGALQWVGVVLATSFRRPSARPARAPLGTGGHRWGVTATWIAVAIPLIYAATRLAWVVGIPLGVSRSFIDELHESGERQSPLGLAGMAVLGALLTWGLVARWGERIPRWVPGAGGRRVPVGAAVVPALFVASVIFPAGIQMTAMAWGAAPGIPPMLTASDWGAYGPTLLWPLWSVALAAAAIAYWLRRRGEPSEAGVRRRRVGTPRRLPAAGTHG